MCAADTSPAPNSTITDRFPADTHLAGNLLVRPALGGGQHNPGSQPLPTLRRRPAPPAQFRSLCGGQHDHDGGRRHNPAHHSARRDPHGHADPKAAEMVSMATIPDSTKGSLTWKLSDRARQR